MFSSECLPGKSIGQIYLQTQRLIGQQSLGEFMGLRVDLQAVFLDNAKKKDVLRKNNCIINTGNNPTKEERLAKIAENKKKLIIIFVFVLPICIANIFLFCFIWLNRYGLSGEDIKKIKLPRFKNENFKNLMTIEEIDSNKFPTIEKLELLMNLQEIVEYKISKLKAEKSVKKITFPRINPKTQEYESENEIIVELKEIHKNKYKVINQILNQTKLT